jgi:hypothetical protein
LINVNSGDLRYVEQMVGRAPPLGERALTALKITILADNRYKVLLDAALPVQGRSSHDLVLETGPTQWADRTPGYLRD